MKKAFLIICCLACWVYATAPAQGTPTPNSYMDEFYKPIMPQEKFLLDESVGYFNNDFGGDNSGKIDSETHFFSLDNSLKFSPLDKFEIGLGFNTIFPAKANLNTYNNKGVSTSTQISKITYVNDYIVNARMRMDAAELYLDMLEKLQDTSREYQANYVSVSDFRVSYRDLKFGARYISQPDMVPDETNLSLLTVPLLSGRQLNMEGEIGYRQGRLTRNENFNSTYKGAQWYQTLSNQYIPRFLFRYGLNRALQAELGLRYTTPYRYKYQRTVVYSNYTTLYTRAKYKLKHNFSIPAGLQWRATDNINIALNSDFNYAKQTLDYYSKTNAGVVTTYPTKTLIYMNADPTLTLTYLYDNDRQIEKDEFSSLTQTLLLKNQFLAEFELKRDITHLNRGSDGGTQNILDPYNIFIYPAEYFVFGTEYAFPYAGNYSYSVGNIPAQNFYQFKGAVTYGLTDSFNAGLVLGYRSSNATHALMIPDYTNRFCKFKPYYFIDPSLDWRIGKNSLLSFESHIVPKYTTYFKEATTLDRKGESTYYAASVSFKALF